MEEKPKSAEKVREEKIEFVMMLKDTITNTISGIIGFFGGLKDAIISVGNTAIFLDRVTTSVKHLYNMFQEVFDLEGLSDTSRQIQDFANYIGVSTDKLQAWQAVASDAGISLDDSIDAFATFNDRVDDFVAGTGYVDEFLHFGFTKDMFKGLDVVDQYLAFGDKMLKMSANDRLAVSSRLLGDQINKIFGPLLTNGGPAFARKMQEAMDIGRILTKDQLAAAREYREVSMESYNIMKSIQAVAGASISPLVTAITKDILPAIKDIKKVFDATFKDYIDDITTIYKDFMAKTEPLRTKISDIFNGPGNTLVRVLKALVPIMVVTVGAFAAIAAIPLALWAAAFAGLIVVVDDVLTWLNGDDSILEDMLVAYPELRDVINELLVQLSEAWQGIKLVMWQVYLLFSSPSTWKAMVHMLTAAVWFFTKFTRFLSGAVFLTRIMVNIYEGFKSIEGVIKSILFLMSGPFMPLLYMLNGGGKGLNPFSAFGNMQPVGTAGSVTNVHNNIHGVHNPAATGANMTRRQKGSIK